jgi:hypothetical protein
LSGAVPGTAKTTGKQRIYGRVLIGYFQQAGKPIALWVRKGVFGLFMGFFHTI